MEYAGMLLATSILFTMFIEAATVDVEFEFDKTCYSEGDAAILTATYTGAGTEQFVKWFYENRATTDYTIDKDTCTYVFGVPDPGYPAMTYNCDDKAQHIYKATNAGLSQAAFGKEWGASFTLSVGSTTGYKKKSWNSAQKCGTSIFSSVNCTSISFFYRECPVPGATEVNKIKLSQNFSQEICEFEISFGFRSNAVWVTEGCSGQFYVCYDGVRISTTVNPGTTVDVPRESVEGTTDNATIYIAIAVTLAVLVLVGVILGCLVKRRQSAEKSRKLAERRQINLEARDSKFDEDIRITPMKRPSSVESIYFPEGTIELDRYEKGSICSSRSSTSGFGSMTSRNTGRFISHGKPVSGGLALVLDPRDVKKSGSVPDVRSAHLEQHLKSNQSYRGSQSSLENIQEMTSSSSSEVPNGGRRRKFSQRPMKYNTVGVRGNCADTLYNPNRGGLTLPGKRLQTRAIVHARRASQDSGISRLTKTGSDMSMTCRSHYEDPQEVVQQESTNGENEVVGINEKNTDSKAGFRPISPASSSTDYLYSTVKKPKKPVILPKPNKDIYSSVNKSESKPVILTKPNKPIYSVVNKNDLKSDTLANTNKDIHSSVNDSEVMSYHREDSPTSIVSLEENNNEHLDKGGKVADESEVFDIRGGRSVTTSTGEHYALMHTFKPVRDYEEVHISAETESHLSTFAGKTELTI